MDVSRNHSFLAKTLLQVTKTGHDSKVISQGFYHLLWENGKAGSISEIAGWRMTSKLLEEKAIINILDGFFLETFNFLLPYISKAS